MNFKFSVLLALISGIVDAHPGGDKPLDAHELARRQILARERHLNARPCAPALAAYQDRRRAKRSTFKKRNDHDADVNLSTAPHNSTAQSPHYTSIQNWTCVTAPEVTEGPYYINNEFIRHDLMEDQRGIKLVLDIGVIDITTCEPLPDAFVEIWSANSTGVYSSYGTILDFPGPPGPPPEQPAPENPMIAFSMPSAVTYSRNNTNQEYSKPGERPPHRGPPGGPPGNPGQPRRGPPMGSPPMKRNETFARGGYATDSKGIVELTTVYPGYYTGRAPHIHTMVHLNWAASENGTLISHAGSVLHIGQFFFEESWNDRVFVLGPYDENTNSRTLNVDDWILEEENSDGNNAFIELELLGDNISDGILGYVTMGVNSSASYSIENTNYLNSSISSSMKLP